MPEGEFGSSIVIESNIRNTRDRSVSCDSNGGQGWRRLKMGIDGEKPLDTSRLKKTGVLSYKVLLVPVVRCKEEIPFPHKNVGCTAQNL
jgi:hypothetical protein